MRGLLIKAPEINVPLDTQLDSRGRGREVDRGGGRGNRLLRFLASADLTALLTTVAFANILEAAEGRCVAMVGPRVLSSYI